MKTPRGPTRRDRGRAVARFGRPADQPVRRPRGGAIPPAYFDADGLRGSAERAMREPEVLLRVRVGEGPGRSRVLGCDLSYGYVRINGEYTT